MFALSKNDVQQKRESKEPLFEEEFVLPPNILKLSKAAQVEAKAADS